MTGRAADMEITGNPNVDALLLGVFIFLTVLAFMAGSGGDSDGW